MDETTLGILIVGGIIAFLVLLFLLQRYGTRALNRGVVKKRDHQLQKELTGQEHTFSTAAALPTLLDEIQRRLPHSKLWVLERGTNGAYISYTAFQHSFKAELLYAKEGGSANVCFRYLNYWNTDGVANCVGEMNELLGIVKDAIRALDPQAKSIADEAETQLRADNQALAQRQNIDNKKKPGVALLVIGFILVFVGLLTRFDSATGTGIGIALIGVAVLVYHGAKAKQQRSTEEPAANDTPASAQLTAPVPPAEDTPSLVFCFKCGKEIEESDEFCEFCGERQVAGGEPQEASRTVFVPVSDTKQKPLLLVLAAVAVVIVLVIIGVVINNTRLRNTYTPPPQTTAGTLPQAEGFTLPPASLANNESDEALYTDILVQFQRIVASRDDNRLGELGIGVNFPLLSLENTDIGYCFTDLDGDGSSELILLYKSSYDDACTILALYTLVNGKPLPLWSFTPYGRCYIGIAWNIIIQEAGDNPGDVRYSLKRLSGGQLVADSTGSTIDTSACNKQFIILLISLFRPPAFAQPAAATTAATTIAPTPPAIAKPPAAPAITLSATSGSLQWLDTGIIITSAQDTVRVGEFVTAFDFETQYDKAPAGTFTITFSVPDAKITVESSDKNSLKVSAKTSGNITTVTLTGNDVGWMEAINTTAYVYIYVNGIKQAQSYQVNITQPHSLTLSSSNNGILQVDNSTFTIKAVSPGTAMVTLRTHNGNTVSKSFTVTG